MIQGNWNMSSVAGSSPTLRLRNSSSGTTQTQTDSPSPSKPKVGSLLTSNSIIASNSLSPSVGELEMEHLDYIHIQHYLSQKLSSPKENLIAFCSILKVLTDLLPLLEQKLGSENGMNSSEIKLLECCMILTT